MNLRNFDRYKTNLMHDSEYIYSYRTKVAKIEDGNLIVDNWYSVTTSKHINYAATQLNLNIIKKY